VADFSVESFFNDTRHFRFEAMHLYGHISGGC